MANKPHDKCSIDDCKNPVHLRGWCRSHYTRWWRHGNPLGGGTGNGQYQDFIKKNPYCSIDGCQKKPFNTRGWCSQHYARWRKYGSPTGGGTYKGSLIAWVKDHIDYEGENCLSWPFHHSKSGYALIDYDGRSQTVARVMCLLLFGEPSQPKLEAAHSCGKGHEGCVNPNHLRWASVSENQMDRVRHGTSNRGEKHWNAKLTEENVHLIRSIGGKANIQALANQFSVHTATIKSVIDRKSWEWLS